MDIWSAGCILAELLHGSPIFPGQTEVEQLHKIFKLCGSEGAADLVEQTKGFAIAAPPRPYPRRVLEQFEKFPKEGLALVDRLLSLDPKVGWCKLNSKPVDPWLERCLVTNS